MQAWDNLSQPIPSTAPPTLSSSYWIKGPALCPLIPLCLPQDPARRSSSENTYGVNDSMNKYVNNCSRKGKMSV